MIKLNYDKRAEKELDEIIDFYFERSDKAAQNFLSSYEDSLAFILNFPEGAEKSGALTRCKGVLNFPVNIHYFYKNSTVYIVAVSHQSRHPDYWKDRLNPSTTPRDSD